MPSIAEAPISPCIGTVNGKKRRWEDEPAVDSEGMMKLASPHHRRPFYDESLSSARHNLNCETSNSEFPPRYMTPRMKKHDAKRQRVPMLHEDAHNIHIIPSHTNQEMRDLTMDVDFDTAVIEDRAKELKVDLSPCHICRRKPTARHELDTFAHCESCGQRSCYVCIRECLGMNELSDMDRGYETKKDVVRASEQRKGPVWHNSTNGVLEEDMLDYASPSPRCDADGLDIGRVGFNLGEGHKGRICSHCCEEKGPDGEVWCLGCLSGR